MTTALILSFSILALVLLHAFLSRVQSDAISAFVLAAVMTALLLLILLWQTEHRFGELFSLSVFFVLVCELYLFLFTLSMASVGSNILVMLHDKPMSRGEFDSAYDSRQMVAERIERLLRLGFLTQDRDMLHLTEKARKNLYWVERVAGFFGHGSQ